MMTIHIILELVAAVTAIIFLMVQTELDTLERERRRKIKREEWRLSRRRKGAELRLAVRRSKPEMNIRFICKDPQLKETFAKAIKMTAEL